MEDKKYFGYMRVSSREQNEDRQRVALLEMGVPEENIYMDKMSGKNFDRPQYKKMLRKLNGNTVVTTVMSNMGLYKALEREGMRYEQTAVGDKYVAENMMANNYSIGGEQSGHIIFSRYAATGDGILTSLMVMEACVDKKSTLCDLAKEMKVYPQLLRNVRVSDKKTALENEKVKAAIEAAAEALGDDGRILVRESGTEPLIRVMVEAGTDELCHQYVDSVVDVMEAEGLVVE